MDALNRLPLFLRLSLIGLGLFLAGGLISFGYSYRPLHGAKNWKIEQLEQRLDERNRENMKLSDEVARLKSEESSQIDPDTFAQVEKELAKTRKTLTQAERDLERSDRKRKEANSSASRWRTRYEKLRDQTAAAAAAPVPAAPATPAPEPAPPALDPAAGTETTPGPAANDQTSPAPGESGMLPTEPLAPSATP